MRIIEVLSGRPQPPELKLDEILKTPDGSTVERLEEGKWIRGRFDKNIRIDQPTYGAGQSHAHILGRKGNELGVVNLDGSASHGTKMTLSVKDADALIAAGFTIRADRIVEWIILGEWPEILFG